MKTLLGLKNVDFMLKDFSLETRRGENSSANETEAKFFCVPFIMSSFSLLVVIASSSAKKTRASRKLLFPHAKLDVDDVLRLLILTHTHEPRELDSAFSLHHRGKVHECVRHETWGGGGS